MTAERAGETIGLKVRDIARDVATSVFEAVVIFPLLSPFALRQALRARRDPGKRREIADTLLEDATNFGESMGIIGRVTTMFFPKEEKREVGIKVGEAVRFYKERQCGKYG